MAGNEVNINVLVTLKKWYLPFTSYGYSLSPGRCKIVALSTKSIRNS